MALDGGTRLGPYDTISAMRTSLTPGLAGAAAGAVNAWLCYTGFPVDLEIPFGWHLVPAGAVHGGVLAFMACALAGWSRTRSAIVKLTVGLCAGWLGGYASSLPLSASLTEGWPNFGWPAGDEWWSTFSNFGLVTLIFNLWLVFATTPRRPAHVAAATVAGIVGSFWWWLDVGPWYLSLLHGSIWGVLVGAAMPNSVAPPAVGDV